VCVQGVALGRQASTTPANDRCTRRGAHDSMVVQVQEELIRITESPQAHASTLPFHTFGKRLAT
jgi:hypothetical protein